MAVYVSLEDKYNYAVFGSSKHVSFFVGREIKKHGPWDVRGLDPQVGSSFVFGNKCFGFCPTAATSH